MAVIFENFGTTFCFWGENVVFRIVILGRGAQILV